MSKILAIVQARMGSSRLPGKVMMDLVGKPMLWHIVNRLSHSELINETVVATGMNDRDNVIESLCQKSNIALYRGSEADLVDRFYQASKLFKADIIIRVTADCPLIDPQKIDEVVEFFLKNSNSYDYVSNSRPNPTYPHGLDVEVFSFSLLERLWKEIKDSFRREWFTTNVFENPDKYRVFCLENETDLSHLRLTVDYPEDLELVRFIYQNLYREGRCFFLQDILELLSSNKEIFDVNKKYIKDEQYVQELEKRGLI